MIVINITIHEFNKLSAEVFNSRLKQADLVTNTDFDDKLKSFDQKTNSEQNIELKKLKHLIRFILEAKAILKKMVQKSI